MKMVSNTFNWKTHLLTILMSKEKFIFNFRGYSSLLKIYSFHTSYFSWPLNSIKMFITYNMIRVWWTCFTSNFISNIYIVSHSKMTFNAYFNDPNNVNISLWFTRLCVLYNFTSKYNFIKKIKTNRYFFIKQIYLKESYHVYELAWKFY